MKKQDCLKCVWLNKLNDKVSMCLFPVCVKDKGYGEQVRKPGGKVICDGKGEI